MTNALLLRILQQNTSFDGSDPLEPISNAPAGPTKVQPVLFARLPTTLLVAFFSVLGKQWILYYTRASTWGSVIDRGKERQAKLLGLRKWKLHLIVESLPTMLQFARLLLGIALIVYLWDLDASASGVVLAVICVGFAFYCLVTVAAIAWRDCPFQTPFSVLSPSVLPWAQELIVLALIWWRRRLKRTSEKSAGLTPNHDDRSRMRFSTSSTLRSPHSEGCCGLRGVLVVREHHRLFG